ncbi:retrovirus-related pol polyprotein from transposon TNT 1-94 [Tanacetum coccineum]
MNQFCEIKGIKREFSVARTPQQNEVVERKNRTIIEAARTMLADSKLPTTFWAEAVNTPCYVQNRVLVIKPHNKTPYELFLGRKPDISFMRPFGCPVTILNTIDHLGSGPNWLFDIDAITKSMNYKPVVAGNQSNGNAGTKAYNDADPKSSPDAGFKPSREEEKKDAEDPANEDSDTNTINTVSLTINDAGIEVNVVDPKTSIELPNDPNMSELEDIVYSYDDVMLVSVQQRTNHKDFQNCLFACFLSQEEPKNVIQALKDTSWIEAMQDKLLQFKLQKVWTLVDLPNSKRAIGANGFTEQEWMKRMEAIRLFLVYASFKNFVVYQMDVKSAFLYGK